MRCSKAIHLIDLKLDGELSASNSRALNQHLDKCPACKAWLSEAAKLNIMLSASPDIAVPAWVHAQIMDKVKKLETAKPSFSRRFKLATVTATLAVFVSLLAGAHVGVQTFKSETEAYDTSSYSVSSASFGETSLMEVYETGGTYDE
jgi:predicted anti-sigma-YlaC factor YlaD